MGPKAPMGPKGPMGCKGTQTGLRLELKIKSDRVLAQNFDPNPMDRVPDLRNRRKNAKTRNTI